MTDLQNWTPRPKPERKIFEGRYVRLEPLNAQKHGDELFAASSVEDAARRFTWLFETPPATRAEFEPWLDKASKSDDPLFFAVIDKASGKVAGRQALMRIDPANGVIEIGSIYWGPLISRRPAATEAQFLFMQYVFDVLGYRRYEWKCHNENGPSRRAAERFGFRFEGIFRQHMVVKGRNRDTAWFSILDSEWPALKQAYQAWLAPENFDSAGQQKKTLQEFRDLG
ncbi:GNAT family N-acetyltransferase [Brucella sp. 10RB9214]|uniref:GNAT family N-acetyltransferase n=1 Tax=unclassified Brucella TaxID=2632610 RepID=UPI000972CD07|nr:MULTISPECIES: GNAT family protein [unclassified Brucella]APY15362.1 GNAT family N-acetyltransferase [Brucella sp. 09RB8910]MRN46555.1 GNAT family N-acetyltransferase [Brucella sp. 10RB9212]MRN50606.1 GNAT family N-acetyltransferase [Brucella sp. 10RB9214]